MDALSNCLQALLSHDDVKPSPRSKSDLCKDRSMQHTHMPAVHHVTMQHSSSTHAAKGAVVQALSQIVAAWFARSKAATVRYFWITHSCLI